MQYLKYIFFVLGFVLLITSAVKYQKRIQKPNESTDNNQEEKRLTYLGFACCAIAVILIIFFG